MDQVTLANVEYKDGLTMDVYYPPDFDFTQNLPVVIFVNGFVDDEIRQEIGCKLKDAGIHISWAQLVAASGMVAMWDLRERLPPDTAFFIVKGGRDDTGLNPSIDRFVEKAREANISVEFVDYEDGIHGFDIWQDTDESREIVKQTVEFMKTHLFEE